MTTTLSHTQGVSDYENIRGIPSKQRAEDLDSAKLDGGWHFSWADYPNYQLGAVAEGKGTE